MDMHAKKKFVRLTATDSITILFEHAEKNSVLHPARTKRYMDMIWNLVKKHKIHLTKDQKKLFCRKCLSFFIIDKKFIIAVLPFILLGSTISALKDAISSDEMVFQAITPIHKIILESHIYEYSYLTVTPGIYILTALILFASLGILRLLKKEQYLFHMGMLLWMPHFLLILPFMKYILQIIPIAILAIIPAIIAQKKFKNEIYSLIVAGHALDGAATFYIIDIFGPSIGKSYFEQHVVGGFIGEFFGTFFAFYILKVLVAWIVAQTLFKEKEDENFKYFIALAIMIMGFAPAIRNILRMCMGV